MSEDRKRTGNRGLIRRPQSSGRFFRLEQLRQLRDCSQVAAICYRVHDGAAEFLLVKTTGGRWTFPKGSTEPGLTHAEAAALEAFEEAGVHGRIEETAFTQYTQPATRNERNNRAEMITMAHLCEVNWLEQPKERDRTPSWFSAAKAKRRLREGRPDTYAAELTRVVDIATARIERRQEEAAQLADALKRVHFIDNPRLAASKAKVSIAPAANRRTRPRVDILPPARIKPRE